MYAARPWAGVLAKGAKVHYVGEVRGGAGENGRGAKTMGEGKTRAGITVKVENLGPLKKAEFEVGDLTLICGKNNTGKTYVTYALYGFLSFWHDFFFIEHNDSCLIQLTKQDIENLQKFGKTEIETEALIYTINNAISLACEKYIEEREMIFGSNNISSLNAKFKIDIDGLIQQLLKSNVDFPTNSVFSLTMKKNDSKVIQIEAPKRGYDMEWIDSLNSFLSIELFGYIFPKAFIASAERTGAVIFKEDINIANKRKMEQSHKIIVEKQHVEGNHILYSNYPLPIEENIEFITKMTPAEKRYRSYIYDNHNGILTFFSDIIGGKYVISRDGLRFIPNSDKKLKLNMGGSGSSVRSLVAIDFYLRYAARQGDLLMIDEPELNLHPENQRKMARLFAMLVNAGIKVFVTTHSDYIVKELSNLITLHQDKPRIAGIREKWGYSENETLEADRVRLYIAGEAKVKAEGDKRAKKINTLTRARIDQETGIEAPTFDEVIDDMNGLQDDIMFGGDD